MPWRSWPRQAASPRCSTPYAESVASPYDEWMRLALSESALALETTDVPVGAVVIGPDGSVLGRGHNVREAAADPTGHAEILALREAAAALGSWRLTGCSLVVT